MGTQAAVRRLRSQAMSWAYDQAVRLLNDAKVATDGASKLVRAARRGGACALHTLRLSDAERSIRSSSSASCFSARSPR